MIRNAVFARGGLPYFKEKRLSRKASFLMVRKGIFARVGFPYFNESRLLQKTRIVIITNRQITVKHESLF